MKTFKTDTQQATPGADHVDAINEMFTKFQLAFHNQFHKAFANDEQIMMAKQLWLNSLCDLPAERLQAGTRRAIKQSAYLPTIHTVRQFCDIDPSELGLPDTHAAYLEACKAGSPKSEQHWSHPAVYLAGKASDWYFLGNNSEAKTFPVFKRNYELLCDRAAKGEPLNIPIAKALPETVSHPLSTEENKQRLQELRAQLDL